MNKLITMVCKDQAEFKEVNTALLNLRVEIGKTIEGDLPSASEAVKLLLLNR